jgi:hypothetical protein
MGNRRRSSSNEQKRIWLLPYLGTFLCQVECKKINPTEVACIGVVAEGNHGNVAFQFGFLFTWR